MNISRPGSKQRLLDALNHRFTGEVPFLETYVAENIVDQVMGRAMGDKHMLQLDVLDYIEFLQRTGMDAAYLCKGWFLGRRNKVDDMGRVHYVDGTIKSRSDFNQIKPPSLDCARRRIETFLDAAEGTGLGSIYALDTAPTIVNTAIGPTDSLLAMVDDPSFLDELMDRVEEYTLPLVDCVLTYPIDAIFLTGPLCANSGPIISLQMHERFIFPRVEKMMDMIRPHKVPVILHSDGDNSIFMDWILRTGFAGIHPVEPRGSFDIYALKAQYGHQICLWGNIDVAGVLTRGTPQEVRADTLEHLQRLAPGGGYICSSSHDITDNIPFENFCSLAQTVCSSLVFQDGSMSSTA